MYERWIKHHTRSLVGKTVAITGATGGLGRHLCRYLASLGADLVLVDRSPERAAANKTAILSEFPLCRITLLRADLSQISSVKSVTEELKALPLDVFIHNAGAYSIPRHITKEGFDNVFQINFASPYYMIRELLPNLRERHGHVMAVGSIAHHYSKTDEADVDFRTRRRASLVYGNAKRYLMFSLFALFENETKVTLSITHPGITFTNITAHYPPVIFALIKHPMKILFMRPRKAALSLLLGVFEPTRTGEWIGPRFMNVWGRPAKRRLHSVSKAEYGEIATRAAQVYQTLKKESSL